MENWNQVAKYEQISANSYGTAIEKMEAYTSGVEAAQKRLTASMEKLALWFNNFGALEGLYNTAATLVDNMAIFAAALLASAIALDKGMAFTLLGNGVGKLTSILGNVGAMFSGIGNLGADKNYFKNLLGLNFAEGSATSLSVVREMYSSALGRATVALSADEKAIYDNIQSTLLSTSADTRKTLASHMLTNSLTENDISLLENTQLEQLLTATTGETVDARKTRLAAEADYTQALRREATNLLNNRGKTQGAMQVMRKNLDDSTTRTGASLAASGIGNIVGMFAGGWSGGAIGNLIGGASGQTIGTMLNSILGGKAGGNLIGGLTSLKGYKNKKNDIAVNAEELYNTTYDAVFSQRWDQLWEEIYSQIGEGMDVFVDEDNIMEEAIASAFEAAQSAAEAFTGEAEEDLKGSILEAFGGPIGLASIGLQIGMAVWSAYLNAQDEALKHAQEKFKEANDKYTEALNASIKTEKYDKLAQGVDYLGRNISLTDEEYQEFLTISNELANVFPDLVVRVDDAGNKFVGMGNSVSGVTEKVNELVDSLKQDVDISIFEKTSKWLGLIKESVFGDAVSRANEEFTKAYDQLYGKTAEGTNERYGGIYQNIATYEEQLENWEDFWGDRNSTGRDELVDKIAKLKKEAEGYESILKTANDELVGYIPSLVQYASTIEGISLGYSGLASQQSALSEESRSVINALSSDAVSKISGVSGDEFMSLALENIQKVTDLVESNPILVDIYYGTNKATTMEEADNAKKELLDGLTAAFGEDGFDEQETAILIKLGFKVDENGELSVDTAINRIKEKIKSAFGTEEDFDISTGMTDFINGLNQEQYGRLNSLISNQWINQGILQNDKYINEVANLIGVGFQTQDIDTLTAQKDYYAQNIGNTIDTLETFYRSVANGDIFASKVNIGYYFSDYSDAARESIYATAQEFKELGETSTNVANDVNEKLEELRGSGANTAIAISPIVERMQSIAQIKFKEAFGNLDLEADGIADSWKELFTIMEAINDTYKQLQDARTEQNATGKLSVQTTLELLSANANYAQALEVVNGQIQLKKNAEEIMAQVQLQSVAATLEAAVESKKAEKLQLEAEYLRLAAGETEIQVTNEAIDSNNAEINSLNLLAKAYANTAQWAAYLAANKKLIAMSEQGLDTTNQEKVVNNLLKQAQDSSIAQKIKDYRTADLPTISLSEEQRKTRMIQIEKLLGSYNEDEGVFAGGSLDKEIELSEALLEDVQNTIKQGSTYEAWKSWYPKPEDIKDASDATKELLDAIDALIDKEYEAMQVWDEDKQLKLGDTQYFAKKEASLNNLKAYWQNKYNNAATDADRLEAEKELMQIEKDLNNLDDEKEEDAYKLLELQGASLENLIEQQRTIIKTSDTEEENLERQEKLLDLLKQQYDLKKEIRKFDADFAKTQMEYLQTTDKSYKGVFENYKQQLKDDMAAAKQMIADINNKSGAWAFKGDREREEAIREAQQDYIDAYQALATAEYDSLNKQLDEIEFLLNKLEKSKPKEWVKETDIKSYYSDTQGYLQQEIDAVKKVLNDKNQLAQMTDEQIKDLVEKYNDYTVALQEAKIEQQEALKDFYDKQYDAVVSKVEEYKKDIQDAIEAIEKAYEKENKKLRENNEERDRAIKLEDLLQAKQNAAKEKEKVYHERIGWVYESSRTKQKQAQRDLDDFYREDTLTDLEKTKEEEVSILQARIDNWDKYLEALAWRHDEHDRLERDAILKQMLNAQTEEEIYNKIAGDMEKFVSNQDNTYKTYIGIFTDFLNQYTACLNQLAALQQQQVSLLNASSYLGLNNGATNMLQGMGLITNAQNGVVGYAANYKQSMIDLLSYAGNYDANGNLDPNALATLVGWNNSRNDKIDFYGMDEDNINLAKMLAEYGLDASGKKTSSGGKSSGGGGGNKTSTTTSTTIKTVDDAEAAGHTVRYDSSKKSYVDTTTRQKLSGYDSGLENGPVAYTGLAMLHGTPSAPEYVLNNDQAYNLLHNMATLRMPEYESKLLKQDNGTQYIVQGDIVLENCDNPEQFWNDVTRAMRNRYNVTKHQR